MFLPLALIFAFVVLYLLIDNKIPIKSSYDALKEEESTTEDLFEESIHEDLNLNSEVTVDEFKEQKQWLLKQNLKALNYISQMENFYSDEKISRLDMKYEKTKYAIKAHTVDLFKDLKRKSKARKAKSLERNTTAESEIA